MLEFEHIVQVNDLTNSSLSVVTRSQLWQGLLLRAYDPGKFNDALQCTSEKKAGNEFVRTIEVGDALFREHVVLEPEVSISTQSLPRPDQIHSESLTRIEEPETNYLFVRFSYKRDLDDRDERVAVGEHLKAAYVQVDRDAIAMIRMLAESRLFDATIN